jgi:hypothetical protein
MAAMPTEQIARLHRGLNSYDEPNTALPKESFLPKGTYEVMDVREGDEADFVQLAVEGLADGDTWICSRWRESRYATIETREVPVPTPPIDHAADPAAVKESVLTDVLESFDGFGYTREGARYPFPLKGFGVPQAPPNDNNCCTFVEALVFGAWQHAHPGRFELSSQIHGQMMIGGSDFFSPVNALIEAGIATPVELDAPPPPWTVMQGWKSQWGGGHTMILVEVDPDTRAVLTLESNHAPRSLSLSGVGFRGIGHFYDQPEHRPPADWRTSGRAPTWEELKQIFAFREGGALKITDRSFAG